ISMQRSPACETFHTSGQFFRDAEQTPCLQQPPDGAQAPTAAVPSQSSSASDPQPEHLPRKGNGRAGRPPRASKDARQAGPGDVVTVTRIDRLARSTFDLFGIVKRIVDTKAQFRSLAEPWADTGRSTGRLMLAVLGGLADVECDLIRTRTAEG